ncbi:hypothetical protein FA15DRAFT_431601 [Coprinopsis marcescibilis]|uniref:YMC020W-like alpha/beta hydrolase domain-containing protein n=1 Tax=Coprinopsis marcescibilis TaxID=230819 RepID=A0A5C3KUN5_COPMA|nr:hypothetical protein FA15DRAFT_431601 [Coprinopsis marcescibilis]
MATTASSSAATPSGRITVSSSSTWWDYVGWGTSNASAGGSGDGVSESAIEDSQSLIGMRDGDQEFDVATGAPTREQSSVISSSSAVSAVRHHSRPPPPPTTSSPTSSSAQAIAGSTPPASSQSRPSSSSAASTDFPSEPTMLQSQACSDSSARTTTAPEHCSHVTSSSSGTSKSKSNSDWKQAVASGSAESAQMSAGAESLEGARKIRHGIGSGTAPGGAEVVGVSKGGMLSRYEEGRLGGGDGCGEDGAKGCGKKDKGAQLNKGGDNDLLGGGGNTGVSKLGELADGGCVDGIGNGAARESLNVGFGVASAKRGGEGANWDGEGGGVLGGAGEAGAEGAGGDPGAVWYSPWSWYYGAPPTSMDVDDTKDDGRPSTGSERCEEQERRGEGVSGTSVPANDEGLVGSGDGRTSTVPPGAPDGNEESVTLEEEGGSGCDPLPPTTGSRSETEAEVNPIEASIQANRSVWASFFSSRALVVKAIGYGAEGGKDEVKRDENGIEVMDVDEDSESELDVQEEERGRTREVGKALVVAKQDSSKDRSVLQTDKKPESTPSTSDRPATPLTQDEGIKEKMKDTVPMTTKVETPTKSGTSTPSTPTKSKPAPQVSKDKSTSTNPSRTASPAPSKKSAGPPSPPNLVLPAWDDIFNTPPRNVLPIRPPPLDLSRGESLSRQESTGMFGKTMKFVSGVLFSKDQHHNQRDGGSVRRGSSSDLNAVGRDSSGVDIESLLERERRKRFERFGEELPKSWAVIEGAGRGSPSPTVQTANGISNSGGIGDTSANPAPSSLHPDEVQSVNEVLRGCKRVVVIGVHGWFPGAVMRTVFGEPTGTSSKFANMMEQALHEFEEEHGVQLEKITKIPLEGEGTIQRRVESNLLAKNEWMDDLHAADAIIVATHSQGSVVSTHLLDRLITDKHIRTATENVVVSGGDTFPSSVGVSVSPERKPQRVCCLALCGIHLGPLRYLKSSSVVLPYIQYFENVAARELFEFQNTESEVSKAYVHSLRHVLYHGVKMVYIASLNDQVVPLYSGLFTAASHPMILRALYIDGDAYHSSDFLSNLLVLLLRLRNSGIPDGGLINHLSEATAGSLNGIGHSRAYEEVSTYSLAVRYLFEANEGMAPYPQLELEPFDAAHEQNDYEIPWTLRDAIADERVIHYFSKEIAQLRDAFREWQPKTTILRDLKRKLQPIQRLPSSFSSSYSTSKL